jgi:hypothetical protein
MPVLRIPAHWKLGFELADRKAFETANIANACERDECQGVGHTEPFSAEEE